jgi:hypothetical protein
MEIVALVFGLVGIAVGAFALFGAKTTAKELDDVQSRMFDIVNRLGQLERAQQRAQVGGLTGGGN